MYTLIVWLVSGFYPRTLVRGFICSIIWALALTVEFVCSNKFFVLIGKCDFFMMLFLVYIGSYCMYPNSYECHFLVVFRAKALVFINVLVLRPKGRSYDAMPNSYLSAIVSVPLVRFILCRLGNNSNIFNYYII